MKSITTTAAVALGMLWGLSSQVNAFVVLQRTSSPGCGKELPAAQMPPGGKSHMTNFTQSDGTKRHYLIHIPSNYEKSTPVPLIFSFHGRTKTAEEQEGLSQFSNENFNPNAIAVYPQGIGKGNSWQGDPDAGAVDDISFTADMISHFLDRYCLDSSRIYAAGKSNGGGLTGLLACDKKLSTQIAAFAPVSGAFYTKHAESVCTGTFPQTVPIKCDPGRSPIPIMEFHGAEDGTIPYAGGPRRGECLPTIPHWVREWSKRDGFGLTNETTSLYGGNVTKYEYGASKHDLGMVTHYLTQGLKHAWPSTEPNDDNSKGTYYNATPIIMNFFNKYTLPL